MFYYLIGVRSNRYHGNDPLTYSSDARLQPGAIVLVELQNTSVLGLVISLTTKPRFKTKLISEVLELPPLPAHLLKLLNWLADYYPAPLGLLTQQFLPVSFSKKQIGNKFTSEISPPKYPLLPLLTNEQAGAIEKMLQQNTYLLHGKTGSGKTRIYLELARKAVEQKKSVIVLTPEISLTTQLAESFRKIFGDRVIVIHSKQSPSQRQEAWLKCLRTKSPMILIGPRSALFAPLTNLGLIILDEAHEGAYKQTQAPQYQTSRVASFLASLTKSTLVMGTATPLVTEYYIAKEKKKPIIELRQLAVASNFAKKRIQIVDRKDNSLFTQSPHLSQVLIKAIEGSLQRNEQTLLYLNRRGTARLVLCENCGWQALCPHCDLPLTYHSDKHQLRCHSCNYNSVVPNNCPSCGHASVVFKTAGTKAIMAETKRIFSQARIARFDTDNLKAESFEQNYESARDGNIDILVGTQILAKGLDLPRLSTVGILLADTSLYLPDYTAQERTFQLVNQVLGRIGRGHVAGQAVIQTYHPDHPILKYAVHENYKDFYETELASRKQFLFPPFCYLLKVTVRRASISSAEQAAESLKTDIQKTSKHVRVEGPAPSFHERLQGKYQWQLVIKTTKRSELLNIIASLPTNCSYDIDPVDLL